ncbi:endoribonuclease MazF [Acidithiobacillus ferrooxidans]|uniref:endoribonuclease MazF n=1 Tax=Acidithiobacillus ferrooxidans TaxID=920 RepID=UPI0021475DFF|nr:endoribonuclease MazF [Acidithiobacillus ferrooxidans]MCR1347086.1 endoribonuclease MazF [Acidithiobacillus ferrooxidans]MCR1355850.1 endoribonuclease MazF [Acidithiobacillus ferrooxidans]
MGGAYVPEAGDIVWLHFATQAGHDQDGHRLALVLTPASYNAKTGLMVCCPIAAQDKGYPFEVRIAGDISGVVLADQVKSLDWRTCQARFKGRVMALELDEAKAKACALIGRKA